MRPALKLVVTPTVMPRHERVLPMLVWGGVLAIIYCAVKARRG